MAIENKGLFSDVDKTATAGGHDAALELWKKNIGSGAGYAAYCRFDNVWAQQGAPGLRGQPFNSCDIMTAVVAHLFAEGVRGTHIADQVRDTKIMPGVTVLFDASQQEGHPVTLVSAGYKPGVVEIASKLRITPGNIFATQYPEGEITFSLTEVALLKEMERLLAGQEADESLYPQIDHFLHTDMIAHPAFVNIVETVIAVGGRRKWEAVQQVCREKDIPGDGIWYQGDGNNDFAALSACAQSGGIAVACNASPALMNVATIGFAGSDMSVMLGPYSRWLGGGKQALFAAVREIEEAYPPGESPVHIIEGVSEARRQAILYQHQQSRKSLNAETARMH